MSDRPDPQNPEYRSTGHARPEPDTIDSTAEELPPPAARRHRVDPAVLMLGIGGLVLVLTLVFLWRSPVSGPNNYVDPSRIDALEGQVRQLSALQGLNGRVDALEGRVRNLDALGEQVQRLGALSSRVQALEGLQGEVQKLSGLEGRVQAVEARQPPDLAPLQGGIADLTKRVAEQEGRIGGFAQRLDAEDGQIRSLAARPVFDPNAVATRDTVERLAQRVDGQGADLARRLDDAARNEANSLSAAEGKLNDRVGTLESGLNQRVGTVESGLNQRVAALETSLGQRVASLEQAQQRLAAVEGRASRLASVDAVRAALENGQPLGNALRNVQQPPEALAKFRDTAPPTDAALRLNFEQYARAARAASDPGANQSGVIDSALARLQGLVTVRRGDTVVFGDAAEAEIEQARRAVQAGDFEAALPHLAKLPPAAQDAIRPWTDQARALIAARAALRQMAAG